MTEPLTLIDRLLAMRAETHCPNCSFPRTQFDRDTLDDAINVIDKLEQVLTREEGAEIKIVSEERRT